MNPEIPLHCELNLLLADTTYAKLKAMAQRQGRHPEELAHDLLSAMTWPADCRPPAVPQWRHDRKAAGRVSALPA